MIHFGDNGWYGVISDNITFENVSIVAQAAADYINESDNDGRTVVVGYDTRFLSREYAGIIQRVLTGNGINVLLHKKPVPSSLLSYSVKKSDADMGIMVTGGTRPARYSGLMFRSKSGLPVDRYFMNDLFNHLYRRYPRQENERSLLKYIDFSVEYIDHIKAALNLTDGCFENKMIIYDSFFGSMGSLPEQCFNGTGADCLGIRTRPNPCFQDCVPRPNERNVQPLSKMVCLKQAQAGFFFGGDGSRFAVVDKEGRCLDEPLVTALVFLEWTKLFGRDFPVYTGLDTPYMVPALADTMKLKLLPRSGLRADEYDKKGIIWEYGGLCFNSVLPDNDALLQCMLMLSALKRCNFNYNDLIEEVSSIAGIRYYNRKTLLVEQKNWLRFRESLLNLEGEIFKDFRCIHIEDNSAVKLIFQEGGFIIFDYNEQESSLEITVDFPGTDACGDIFDKIAIDLEI